MTESISLTEEERQLFHVLCSTVEHFSLNTVIRVAGGWVRDKLLSRNNEDIDIAVDNMSGEEFATYVNRYVKEELNLPTKTIGVIRTNPEQSKHLETAAVSILGVTFDIANLRSETYTDSRIPNIVPGTAEEDAFRRDFTINSMFYRLGRSGEQNMIEDLTGHGLKDLHEGVIRTPLDPIVTFTDDPLRVLRAIRFSSRFEYEMTPELIEAAQLSEVRNALGQKISRERIGKEFEGMMKCETPDNACSHISRFGIWNAVFTSPEATIHTGGRRSAHEKSRESLLEEFQFSALCCIKQLVRLIRSNFVELEGDMRFSAILAALLHSLDEMYIDGKKKPVTVIEYIILESLKLPRRILKLCQSIVTCSTTFQSHQEDWKCGSFSRKDCGLTIRQARESWIAGWAIALSRNLCFYPSENSSLTTFPVDSSERKSLDSYLTLRKRIEDEELCDVWDMKPLFNGKELNSTFGLSGPAIGRCIERCIEWQLENPTGTKEELKLHLESNV